MGGAAAFGSAPRAVPHEVFHRPPFKECHAEGAVTAVGIDLCGEVGTTQYGSTRTVITRSVHQTAGSKRQW